MTSSGPFTRTELDLMRALAQHHQETSVIARDTLRLIGMIDARDEVIRRLCAELDRLDIAVANILKGWDAV